MQYGHCEHSGHAATFSSNFLGADCNDMDDRGDAGANDMYVGAWTLSFTEYNLSVNMVSKALLTGM
jgi:hypothetical protein